MKIALVCSGLGNINRGHEVFAKSIYSLLKDDLNMTLIKGGGEQKENEIIIDHIPRYSVLLDHMHLNVSEKWRKMIQEGKREEIEFKTFAYSALKQFLTGNYDIVHCLEKPITDIIWNYRYLFKKRPRILFSNGGALTKRDLPNCDFIQEYTEHNMNRGIKEKSILIPHGVDLSLFDISINTDFRTKYNIPKESLMILSVGRVCYWHKRMDYVIKEVSKIKDAYLVIIGQPSLDSTEIETLGKNLLGDKVFFLQMPHEELPNAYKAADIFTLGSLNETFGIVYLEAMAMGIPVIATDHLNIRQILKNQLFINMNKEGELAKALRHLDRYKIETIGKNGREIVEKYYDLNVLKNQYIEMYSKLFNSEIIEERYSIKDKIKNNILNLLRIQ